MFHYQNFQTMTQATTIATINTNCLAKFIYNEYGDRYGTLYIFFPYKQVREDVLQKMLIGWGVDPAGNLAQYPSSRFWLENEEPEHTGDVWNQNFVEKAASIEEAVKIWLKW